MSNEFVKKYTFYALLKPPPVYSKQGKKEVHLPLILTTGALGLLGEVILFLYPSYYSKWDKTCPFFLKCSELY